MQKTIFALVGLAGLACAQQTANSTIVPPQNQTISELARERRWKRHQQWMGQIARMGKHACSHDSSQNYLMKRMIDAVHAAAKNRCGGCAGRRKVRRRKQVRRKRRNWKRARKSKRGWKKRRNFNKVWMRNCKRIHGKNWKKVCRINKPKPKPKPEEPKPDEPSNPGDGDGDGNKPDEPEPFVCDQNKQHWEQFEQAGGVREMEGFCKPGLDYVALKKLEGYTCYRKDVHRTVGDNDPVLIARDFRVTRQVGDCKFEKNWRHQDNKIIETIMKNGQEITNTCGDDRGQYHQWENAGGVKEMWGEGTCTAGNTWAAAQNNGYTCSKVVTEAADGTPVTTFAIKHGNDDCNWEKRYIHSGGFLKMESSRKGQNLADKAVDTYGQCRAKRAEATRCGQPLDKDIVNKLLAWETMPGSKIMDPKTTEAQACAAGRAWANSVQKDYQCFKNPRGDDNYVWREETNPICKITPVFQWHVRYPRVAPKCQYQASWHHARCKVYKSLAIDGCAVYGGWHDVPNCEKVYKDSEQESCKATAVCNEPDWSAYEKVNGVKAYKGQGSCADGNAATAGSSPRYDCSVYKATGIVAFTIRHGSGNCAWVKRYVHNGTNMRTQFWKSNVRLPDAPPITTDPSSFQVTDTTTEFKNGVQTGNSTTNVVQNGGGRRLRSVRRRRRGGRAARDNLCAIYMRHVFALARKG